MPGALEKFLQKNTIKPAKSLPLVHTTSAYRLVQILESQQITPTICDVFEGEKLNYFFVGRPAYKKEPGRECEIWELPTCVILDYASVPKKRVFPFDSGAFKARLFPDFIQMMNLDSFEVSNISDACERLIGAFFVTPHNYFKLNPRSQKSFERMFDIGILDAEVKALYKLILFKTGVYDDRRFAIEVQCDSAVALNKKNILAVVFPEEYCESDTFMDYIEKTGAEAIPYQSFPVKAEFYYYAIYDKIFEFYSRSNF